jgi:hypothetical protein
VAKGLTTGVALGAAVGGDGTASVAWGGKGVKVGVTDTVPDAAGGAMVGDVGDGFLQATGRAARISNHREKRYLIMRSPHRSF